MKKYILPILLLSNVAFAQRPISFPNLAQDQDNCLKVNDGGTPTNGLCVDGPTANVGIGTDATHPLHFFGNNNPATDLATSVSNANVRLQSGAGTGNSGSIYLGSASASNDAYMQVSNGSGSASWDLSLNPYGGDVQIGSKFKVDGTSGDAEVPVPNGGCGTGSLCSGTATQGTVTMTDGTGASGCAINDDSNNDVNYFRVGRMVTITFRYSMTKNATDANCNIVGAPFITSNFTKPTDGIGICSLGTGTQTVMAKEPVALSGTQTLRLRFISNLFTGAANGVCTFTYFLR